MGLSIFICQENEYGAAVVKSSSNDFNPSALLHLVVAPSSNFAAPLFGILLSRVFVALKKCKMVAKVNSFAM